MRSPANKADLGPPSAGDTTRDLRLERDRYVGFAFAAADLLLEVAGDDTIRFAAGAAKALTGVVPAALMRRRFASLFPDGERAAVDELIARIRHEDRVEPMTLTLARGKGDGMRVTLSGCRLPGKDDALYVTITALRPEMSPALVAARRDRETGLLDQSSFGSVVADALLNARKLGGDIELSLLQLGGIAALRARTGDESVSHLLTEIGAFLRHHAVGGTHAGRLAEDRFGLIRSQAARGVLLGDEIERIARSRDPEGQGLEVTERGVALKSAELTADDAARALAFTLGRFAAVPADEFSISSLTDGFRLHIDDTVTRISQLKNTALERDFAVAFQPIIRLGTREVCHFEMLARFEGEKSPFEMIQFAEGVGMIEEIDLCICRRAIAMLEALPDKGSEIAVNLSGKSLSSDVFVQSLLTILEPHADLRRRLLFEITESTVITDLERAERILAVLRRAGHRICLDDFGVGASSFPYLQALTVDFVKLDGGYVGRMGRNPKDWAILKAMVSLCGELKIGTIAEMIEREDQVQDLLNLRVVFGQGFLFGRPTPSPTVPAALTKKPR
jgi:EAL domain-containing protein (putative c-di-GMP-specific phosphodiesterase class I)/GGDEF domain-containing protein